MVTLAVQSNDLELKLSPLAATNHLVEFAEPLPVLRRDKVVYAFASYGFGARSAEHSSSPSGFMNSSVPSGATIFTHSGVVSTIARNCSFASISAFLRSVISTSRVDAANDTAFRIAQHGGIRRKPESRSVRPFGDTFNAGWHLAAL